MIQLGENNPHPLALLQRRKGRRERRSNPNYSVLMVSDLT